MDPLLLCVFLYLHFIPSNTPSGCDLIRLHMQSEAQSQLYNRAAPACIANFKKPQSLDVLQMDSANSQQAEYLTGWVIHGQHLVGMMWECFRAQRSHPSLLIPAGVSALTDTEQASCSLLMFTSRCPPKTQGLL